MQSGESTNANLDQFLDTHTCFIGSVADHRDVQSGQLYPYILAGEPNLKEFLTLIREHGLADKECNPLDGREHDLLEISSWLQHRPLRALQFICVGIGLGVFRLSETWKPSRYLEASEERVDIERWLEAQMKKGYTCRFKCDIGKTQE